MASKPKKAEIEQADEAEEGQAKKPGLFARRSTKIILAAVALVVLAGGGASGYFFLAPGHENAAETAKAPPVSYVDVPDVLVNLSNTSGDRTQYLKVKITLEVPDETLVQQITPVMPRVVDAFQTYLRELRPADLDGSAGLFRLKEELTRRVNMAIAPGRINAVLFKEIIVQ